MAIGTIIQEDLKGDDAVGREGGRERSKLVARQKDKGWEDVWWVAEGVEERWGQRERKDKKQKH